jgi:site-specific DNA recombinase
MSESKRAVIYARVATHEPLNDHGLSAQVEACRKYAARHSLTVTEDHIIAEVYSGAKINRPGLARVRVLADRRAVEAVIVSTPDRLSRYPAHLLRLCEEWQLIGIEVHYVSCRPRPP